MVRLETNVIVFLVLVDAMLDIAASSDGNQNKILTIKKKKNTNDRSTSSSSGEEEGGGRSSLDMSESKASGEGDKPGGNQYVPKSSEERKGWRKWHRKCTRCEEDEVKKWRDPSIKWICGAYQRARRSFKSLCLMHYRNCQDGTMFIKIGDHRCPDDKSNEEFPHGDHFFYEYGVNLFGESTKSDQTESEEEASASDNYD